MNKNIIDVFEYAKAEIGWAHLSKLAEHLGKINSSLDLFYSFSSMELVILDDKLLDILRYLKIPYQYKPASNSIKFIKKIKKERKK